MKLRRLWQQREGDDGFGLRPDLFKQFGFKLVRDGHFAGSDLLRSRADEAELTVAQAFSAILVHGANRRPKDAAGHRAPLIDIASPRRGIECGTSCVVGEVFKAGLIGF